LAWAKKKGWIQMAGGKVSITNKGKEILSKNSPVEEGLKGNVHDENINELKARKLVDVKEKKTKKLSLTEKGKSVLPHIKELKEVKEAVGQLTPTHIKTGEWKKSKFREYDIKTPVPTLYTSTIHPYIQFLNETRRKMIALGFQETKGPFTETEFWNADALFMPQDHPARGIHDVFKLKSPSRGEVRDKVALERVGKTHKDGWITGSTGWGKWDLNQTLNLVLRSHTTCVSARTLASKPEIPSKFFTIDRDFRPDVLDATHAFEFHQLDGIIIGENLNIRNLLGYLELLGREVAGAEDIRFRPGYFPFTEPSVEMDAKIDGKWMEIGGSGIFRPELTKPLGIDATVLAWGLGFGRLAMIRLGISDMRDLFNHDIEWLRKRRIVV
ncbi:MAG: phenylalanine--tRNA ligase subunit alpha, partial [Deltaproteobacteria bacterium]|nr:phenylalanine--tRNA ligase subunit alpha [Deltaproteobacteria bacterium]